MLKAIKQGLGLSLDFAETHSMNNHGKTVTKGNLFNSPAVPSFLSLVFLLLSLIGLCQATDTSYSEIVQNVNQVVCMGTPGSVWASSDSWIPILGDNSIVAQPPVLVLARQYGSGRVVTIGHEGVVASTDVLDNGRFVSNVFTWLANGKPKTIAYLDGCFVGAPVGSNLYNTLTASGFSVTNMPRPITAAKLNTISCLMVGNTWTDFNSAEITAVQDFVQNGGGLLMCGLGWSWVAYHPTLTMEDYPMTRLAAPYEVRWLNNYLRTETLYNGYPVFKQLYPNLPAMTVSDAMAVITAVNQAYPVNLPGRLQADQKLRDTYVRAHMLLTIPVYQFPVGHSQRIAIYDYYRQMMASYPNYFTRTTYYDPVLFPCFVQLRERVFITLLDAKQIDDTVKAEIASSLQLAGKYLDIWNARSVFLVDNNGLSESQKNYILNYLLLIPRGLDNLRFISVRDFLGTFSYGVNLSGTSAGINIFGVALGAYQENSFPSDGEAGWTDLFSVCMAHEHNHIVDAYTITYGKSNTMNQRRFTLIEQATPTDVKFFDHSIGAGVDWGATKASFQARGFWDGNASNWQTAWNNYWASGPGSIANANWLRNNLKLMCEAPQESFATLANQYFTDSRKMLNLAFSRWNAGRTMCINQFLFFVDVYSR